MQILNLKEYAATQNVLASFDAYSDKMRLTFRHLRLIRSKKGHLFIAFPCQSIEIGEGKKQYVKHYEFDGQIQKDFEKSILEALKPYVRAVQL